MPASLNLFCEICENVKIVRIFNSPKIGFAREPGEYCSKSVQGREGDEDSHLVFKSVIIVIIKKKKASSLIL